MQIRMKSIAAGPEWSAQPGQSIDLPEAEARQLVEGGYAEDLDAAPVETADDPGPDDAETAEAPGSAGAETATAKRKAETRKK